MLIDVYIIFNPLYANIFNTLIALEHEKFFRILHFGEATKCLKTRAKVFTNSSKVN